MVVVSAVTARETIVAARAAGVRAYLLKAIAQLRLGEALGDACGLVASASAHRWSLA